MSDYDSEFASKSKDSRSTLHDDALGMTTAQQIKHLDWTAKQSDILTGGGKAEDYYTAERGFPFEKYDLPHYHLLQGDTHETFREWKSSKPPCSLVCGVWNRPLFVGGWQHSSDEEERVYNIQTHTLFIDLRIPKSREVVLKQQQQQNCTSTSLEGMSPHELRLYARQHVFAGFTVMGEEKGRPLATRHHCVDWNFVGVARSRPNKWWIHVKDDDEVSAWKEYSYAKDDNDQHYYFERWERYPRGGPEGPRLAMRTIPRNHKHKSRTEALDAGALNHPEDAILVLVDDHFNYIQSRNLTGKEKKYPDCTSLVAIVDEAIANDDLETARAYLSIQAGHGRVSNRWKLDCAIPHWNEGKSLSIIMEGSPTVFAESDDPWECDIQWIGRSWELFDCTFDCVGELQQFLSSLTIENASNYSQTAKL